jgi:hypothetical protein
MKHVATRLCYSEASIDVQSTISQKVELFTTTAVRTSNLTEKYIFRIIIGLVIFNNVQNIRIMYQFFYKFNAL